MQQSTSSEKRDSLRMLSFYLHERRKWHRILAFRSILALSTVLLAAGLFYKQRRIEATAASFLSVAGLASVKKANFYCRRSAYRVRQQRKSLERSE